MSLRSFFRPLLAAALLGSAQLAAAQAPAALPTKIKVYIVGTFHFNASSGDIIKGTRVDMGTPEKQRELDELATKLQKTQADKVFVEWPQDRQVFVDSTYARYRQGQRQVGSARQTNNEVVQVGYRLANRLGRPRVYCADADGVFDYPAAQLYAKAYHQEYILTNTFSDKQLPDSVGALIAARTKAIAGASKASQAPAAQPASESLLAQFRRMNTEAADRANMDSYLLQLARVGGGENYAGADLAGEFYKRNVRIYTNLMRAVDVQHDRAIVLIIGQGHAGFLKEILRYSSLFEVAEVLPLLEAK